MFLERCIYTPYDPEVTTCGFKLMGRDQTAEERELLLAFFRETDTKVIHLWRENKLAAFVSLKLAQRDNVWSLEKGAKPASRQPITVDPEELVHDIEDRMAFQACARDFFQGISSMELTYEQLVGDFDRTMTDIQRFLEVPVQPLAATKEKLGAEPLEQIIENYEEVRSYLQTTAWKDML